MSNPAWPFPSGIASTFQRDGLSYVPYLPVKHSQAGTGPVLSSQEDDITYKTWTGRVKLTTAELLTWETFVRESIAFGAIAFLWKDYVAQDERLYKLLSWENAAIVGKDYWEIAITVQEQPE